MEGWTHAGNPETFSVWHISQLAQMHKRLESRQRGEEGRWGGEGREGRRRNGRVREKRTRAKVLSHCASCFSEQDHQPLGFHQWSPSKLLCSTKSFTSLRCSFSLCPLPVVMLKFRLPLACLFVGPSVFSNSFWDQWVLWEAEAITPNIGQNWFRNTESEIKSNTPDFRF